MGRRTREGQWDSLKLQGSEAKRMITTERSVYPVCEVRRKQMGFVGTRWGGD